MKDTKDFTVSFLDYRKVESAVEKDLGFNIKNADIKLSAGDKKYRSFWDYLSSEHVLGNNSVFMLYYPFEFEDEAYSLSPEEEKLKQIIDAFLEYGDLFYVCW